MTEPGKQIAGEAWLTGQLSGLSQDVAGAFDETREWSVQEGRDDAFGAALREIENIVRGDVRHAENPDFFPYAELEAFILSHGATAAERCRWFGYAEGLADADRLRAER